MPTDVLKVLGQSAPAAKTLTTIYTVPTSTEAKVFAVLVCNRHRDPTTFRIAISPAGAADTDAHYQYYDTIVPGNKTMPAPLGPKGITLEPTDEVRVYAYDATLSFSVHGVEVLGGTRGLYIPWTPTYVNLTIGNGVVVSRYIQLGDDVRGYFHFTLGDSSSVGTTPTISTPVTASASYVLINNWIGGAMLNDSGSEGIIGSVRLETVDTMQAVSAFVTGTHIRHAGITSTSPFTWTTGDSINFSFGFEAAP